MSLVTNESRIGKIKGFPLILVLAMQREQFLQGNDISVVPFQINARAGIMNGAFNWRDTRLGHQLWYEIIERKHFEVFFSFIENL